MLSGGSSDAGDDSCDQATVARVLDFGFGSATITEINFATNERQSVGEGWVKSSAFIKAECSVWSGASHQAVLAPDGHAISDMVLGNR